MGSVSEWLDDMASKYGFGSKTEQASGAAYETPGGHVAGGRAEVGPLHAEASGEVLHGHGKGVKSTLGYGNAKIGVKGGEDGYAGAEAGAGLVKIEVDATEALDLDDNLVVEGDVSAMNASAGVALTDDGLSAGAQANYLEGSITLGTTGTGDADEETRVGLSAGGGAAGRVHWGDRDGDGNAEYGIGVDVGPISADIKTEDPLRTYINTATGVTGQAVTNLIDGNMTHDAVKKGEEFLNDASGAADDLLTSASNWWNDDD